MNFRAASEVVGALMVISLIVSVAGILYAMSYPIIAENEETIRYRKAYFDLLEIREKIENVRSGFEFNSSYALRLSGVSISFQNEPIIFVNETMLDLSSIKISGSGWELYYENGAIFERRLNYLKILHYPDIYYDTTTDTLTMPIIKFTGNMSAGGKGILTLNLKLQSVSKHPCSNCTVKIVSSNHEGWKNFLKEIGVSILEDNFKVSKLDIAIYEVRIQ